MASRSSRTRDPHLPLVVPSARYGTGLDDRCSPLLPPDPQSRHGRMCWDCGRVNTRRDTDGSYRCLGALPALTGCTACGEAMSVYAAGQTAHPNCAPGAQRRIAITRQLEHRGIGWCTCTNAPGQCPHCTAFAALLTTEDPMPDHRTTPPASLLDVALSAAGRGWHVFPIRPGSKRPPAITAWEQRATTDPDRIRRCWATGDYNVGIACGPSGLLVIDPDVPKPGAVPPIEWQLPGVATGEDVLAVLAERAGQPLPYDTYTVATPSGGRHLYFRHPDGCELRNTNGGTTGSLGWLIDTRAHGGYVVAAGSRIGGSTYEVVHDVDPAPLPPWLFQLLSPPGTAPSPRPVAPVTIEGTDRAAAYVRSALQRETDIVVSAPTGQRNHTLYTAATALGQLVAGGALTATVVTETLEQAAADAGLPEHEARTTIRSGLKAGARRPRQVAA